MRKKPTIKETKAFIAERADRDPDRFDSAIGEHEWINFEVHPDELVDVQLIYQADHGTLYVNMELSDVKGVHEAFGRAIEEREEELRFFPSDEER